MEIQRYKLMDTLALCILLCFAMANLFQVNIGKIIDVQFARSLLKLKYSRFTYIYIRDFRQHAIGLNDTSTGNQRH